MGEASDRLVALARQYVEVRPYVREGGVHVSGYIRQMVTGLVPNQTVYAFDRRRRTFSWYRKTRRGDFTAYALHGGRVVRSGTATARALADAPRDVELRMSEPPEVAAALANPGFRLTGISPDAEEGYRRNCFKAVSAWELRMRGRDVRALPSVNRRELSGITFSDFMDEWGTQDLITVRNRNAAASVVTDAAPGARFFVGVALRGGGGHVFVATNDNGVAKFLDPQAGEPISDELWDLVVTGAVWLVPSNDLTPSLKVESWIEPETEEEQ